MNGISHVAEVAGDKFDMVLSRDHKEYNNLPGIYVLVGGLWVANLYYWGFNQYIIQRTLAAKSLKEAQRGIAFAAFLKMLIPFIVAVPGIVAWVMYSENMHDARSAFEIAGSTALNNDNAYPWLISTFIPAGLKGLVLAALAAAIVSSLASMLNSTSTIFTMDIYKPYMNREASQAKLVNVGRLTAAVALVVAVLLPCWVESTRCSNTSRNTPVWSAPVSWRCLSWACSGKRLPIKGRFGVYCALFP